MAVKWADRPTTNRAQDKGEDRRRDGDAKKKQGEERETLTDARAGEERAALPDHGPLTILKELFKRYGEDQCSAWAAALSFFGLLSFVPLMVCGIAALGFFIQDPQSAAEKVEAVLRGILPGAAAGQTADKLIKDAGIQQRAADLMKISSVAGLIGVLSLLWTASRIFVSAAAPMNAAFRVKESRGFLMMQVYALGLLFGAGALFLLSLLPTLGPDFLRNFTWFSRLPDPSPWFMDLLFLVLGVAVNAAMYTVIYRFLPSPSARVTWKQAAFAGVIVAILWEAAKQGFAIYLRNFGGSSSYDKVYGSLGGLVILILWVYYSSILLLLGGEIAKLRADVQRENAEEAQERAAKTAKPSPV